MSRCWFELNEEVTELDGDGLRRVFPTIRKLEAPGVIKFEKDLVERL
jgi:hypothetical protein